MNRTFASYTPFAALAAVFALGAVCLAPARADAACSAALQAHVRAGTAALDRSAGGRSASAAAALGRNVDLASREIGSCPDPQTRRSYDELVAWKVAFELANRGPDPAAARVLARRLRDDLARFYRDGGLDTGAVRDATAAARESLAFFSTHGYHMQADISIGHLADALARDGRETDAAVLLGYCNERVRKSGAARGTTERRGYERTSATCSRVLGSREYELCLDEGAAIDIDEAAALALSLTSDA